MQIFKAIIIFILIGLGFKLITIFDFSTSFFESEFYYIMISTIIIFSQSGVILLLLKPKINLKIKLVFSFFTLPFYLYSLFIIVHSYFINIPHAHFNFLVILLIEYSVYYSFIVLEYVNNKFKYILISIIVFFILISSFKILQYHFEIAGIKSYLKEKYRKNKKNITINQSYTEIVKIMGKPDNFCDYKQANRLDYIYGPCYRKDSLTTKFPFFSISYGPQYFMKKDVLIFKFNKIDMTLIGIENKL